MNPDLDYDDVSVMTMLNPFEEYLSRADRKARLEACKGCELFKSFTRQCSSCGCFMPAKTWLARAKCPQGVW